jgi:hypothetical protein
MNLAGTTVETDISQCSNRAELAVDTFQLEDRPLGRRLSSGNAVAHPVGYINARTSSGTSEVPDTVGVTRSGLQSAAVTSRITWGTMISGGITAPARLII